MTLHKTSEQAKVKTGMVSRGAGLCSQLCHDFDFALCQALHLTLAAAVKW